MATYNKTLFLNVPDGYEVKYQIVKIRENQKPAYVIPEVRQVIVEDDDVDTTKIMSRRPKYQADYNKHYYQRRKAKKIEELQIKSKLIDM
jgi:hypothetical protein